MIDVVVGTLAGWVGGCLFTKWALVQSRPDPPVNIDTRQFDRVYLPEEASKPAFVPIPKNPRKSWQKIKTDLESRTSAEQQREARVRSHNAG